MKKIILAMALVGSAAPLAAQTATGQPATSTPSPEALALSQKVIDRIWPLGTYRRLMDGTMSRMIGGMMDQMFQVKGRDVIPSELPGSAKAKAEAGDKSIGALAAEHDPHFRERMRITTDVMFKEMLPLFDRVEPTLRVSMTRIYARKFSAQQLRDLDAFFATPTGSVYAREWMTSFMDPEIMTGMQSFAPEMMKAMPAIMAKVVDATKHLPPPPKRKTNDD